MFRKLIVVALAVVAMGTGVLWFKVVVPSPRPIGPVRPVGPGLPLQTGPPPPRLQVNWDYAEITINLGRLGGVRPRYLIIPFWVVVALFSICVTVVLLRVPLWRYRRNRLVIATLSFWLSLLAILWTLSLLSHVLQATGEPTRTLGRLLGSEAVALALLLAFLGGASYAVARTIFSMLGRPSGGTTGFCQTCGYNLTDNVSGVCPECGTEVPPP